MKILGVGHVVLKVRDVERAARFYRDVLGLKEVARFPGRMVFFSAGANHHDLAVLSVGPDAPAPSPEAVGLYHVALKIGGSLEELKAAKAHLEAHGVTIQTFTDHQREGLAGRGDRTSETECGDPLRRLGGRAETLMGTR